MKSRVKLLSLVVVLVASGFTNVYAQGDLTPDQMMNNLHFMAYKVDSLQKKVQMMDQDMKQWIMNNPQAAKEIDAQFMQYMSEQVSYMLWGLMGSFNQIHFLMDNSNALSRPQINRNMQRLQSDMLEITGKLDDVVLSMERIQKGIQAKKVAESE